MQILRQFYKNKIPSRQIPRRLTSMYLLRLVTLLYLELLVIPYMKYVEHVGETCIEKFIDYLEKVCYNIHVADGLSVMRIKARRNNAERAAFDLATQCHICKVVFAEARGR